MREAAFQAGDQGVVAEGCAIDIFGNDVGAAVDAARLQQAAHQGLILVGGLEHQFGHEVRQQAARLLAAGAAAVLRVHVQAAGRLHV